MDEQNKSLPEQWPPVPPQNVAYYQTPPRFAFLVGQKELRFGAGIILFSLLLCNGFFFAGPNLAFALGAAGTLICTFAYLRSHGHRAGWYTGTLVILSLVTIAAFPRSADGAMKFLLFCLLPVVNSLALCLMAGQNIRLAAGFCSLLEGPRVLFGFGIGRMPEAFLGIKEACRTAGAAGKKGGAVALGLAIAVPLLAVMIPLLMSADAAFEGLLDQLPEFRFHEFIVTAAMGFLASCIFYTRGTALQHLHKSEKPVKIRKGCNRLTVNTVLIAVAVVYGAYLVSQLAYFVGGFSGILPEEFTLAQYARRGFFEMAWLCAINLGLIGLCVGLVSPEGRAPLSTRLLCLFLGMVTLFLVAAASAKMLLYIGSYGLTRLRVTTEVFMLWLALTTVFVCIWLFREKLPYMKLTVAAAMVLLAVLMWADVDSVVARYNVRAYQSGKLETVDVWYLAELNDSAVPYLQELTADADPEIAGQAKTVLTEWYFSEPEDLRSWNYAKARALEILETYHPSEAAEVS